MAKYRNTSNSLVTIYAKEGAIKLSKNEVKEIPDSKELDRLVKRGILEAVEQEKPAKKAARKNDAPDNDTSTTNNS